MTFKDETPATMLSHTNEFLRTNNFLYAMSAFCRARANGDPIPEEILATIENAFLEWDKYNGKKSLDEILKLKVGSGSQNVLSQMMKINRNIKLFGIMAILIELGFKEKDAAEAACNFAQSQYDINPEAYRMLKPYNSGRKDYSEKGIVLDAESLRREKRNNKNLYIDAECNATRYMALSSEQEKEDIKKFYSRLIAK